MKRTSGFTIVVLATLILTACNLPLGAEASPTADQAFLNTAVAQTVDAVNAAATAAAAAISSPTPLPPTNTPLPAATNTPVPSEPTVTTVPSTATVIPGSPIVSATTDTNCRFGPGPAYGMLGFLLVKDGQYPVKGRNSSNSWWYIVNPRAPTTNCWVWGSSTRVEGDVGALPVVNPPAITVGVGVSPSNSSGPCPVDVTFSASLTSNGPVTYVFRFETSEGYNTSEITATSTGAGSVGGSYTKSYGSDTDQQVRVHLLSPQGIYSGWKTFKINCP